jgi:P-type Mg2+ transporter
VIQSSISVTSPKMAGTRAKSIPVSPKIRPQTLDAAYATSEELLASLKTSDSGLRDREASDRLAEHGFNEVAYHRTASILWQFFRNFGNPFVGLLSALSMISFLVGAIEAGSLISFMVVVSVLLRFIQEFRSTRIMARLRALVGTNVTVTRISNTGDRHRREIPLRELVPGDIIHLAAGDMIAADIRLLLTRDLFVSQSVLSGEALPVEKFETLQPQSSRRARIFGTEVPNPTDLPNLCFMGSNVVSGTATAVVVATGEETLFASFARRAVAQRSLTSFDRGINSVSWLFIRFMLLLVPVVLLLNGFTKGDWASASLFALSVAVGLTPEMLPVVIAANLTRGAISMVRNKVIVKRLNSIEDLGAMNILCIDKTGTLTIDRIILERHLDTLGNADDAVLRYAYLNSYFQTGLKNLLDAAILEHGELHEALHIGESYRKVDELPFDFGRRRMSVIVEQQERQQHELICKGAVEEVLEVCSSAKVQGAIVPLSRELRNSVSQLCDEMNEEGLRVLALAYKDIAAGQANYQYRSKDEAELVLAGFIAFLDPPKESSAEALAALRAQGVEVKILTGDSELVARRICRWVNLEVENALLGSEVESMSDAQLQNSAAQTTLFAKLTPLQKSRVISALKAAGNTVGFLGDGINDAAALREADVGISVDTAVAVAKESADIVMLEKSLTVLVDVVIEGRRNAANIVKYIKMAASSNFGNILTVLGSSAFLAFLPMLPLQLLVQNLLYDLSQTTIPFDPVDAEDLAKPRRWEAQGIARFMFVLGPISSVFDLATFALLWWALGANTIEKQALFQSGWFVEGLLSQTLIVHMIRTRRVPFFQSWPCAPLLFTTLVIVAIGAFLPFTAIGPAIGLVRLPFIFYFWLAGILFSYCLVVQTVKIWFLRQFKAWI